MAHMVESMVYAGETPWHGLGKAVPQNLVSDEVDAAAGLDWTVDLKHVQVCGGKTVEGVRAVVRSSDKKALGIVSEDYSPIQNGELRGILDSIASETGAKYHTAGSLNGGADVWYLMELPGTEIVLGKAQDRVKKFLLGTTNHVAKRRARILPSPTRVVCMNTLRAALTEGSHEGVAITHIGDTAERLRQAIESVRNAIGYYEQFEAVAQKLVAAPYTDAMAQDLAAKLFPAKNIEPTPANPGPLPVHWLVERQRDNLRDLIENGKGHEAIRGTAWAAWNGVAEFTDWQRGSDDNRVDSAWFGEGARMKQKAYEFITEQVARAA